MGAVLIGGFMVLRGGQSDEVVPAPPPAAQATPATGATGSSSATGKHKKKSKKHKTAVAAVTPATGATGATGGTGATGEPKSAKQIAREKLVAAAKAAGMPTPVYDAWKHNKEVIVFFWEPKGKDDERVNDALLNLEKYRKGHLVVFRDKISNASKYDGIAQAGQLTQTPGMVIMYKTKATTAQGYYDAAAINQKIVRLSGYVPPGS